LAVVKTSHTEHILNDQYKRPVHCYVDSTFVIVVGFIAGFITGACIALWPPRRKGREPVVRGPHQLRPLATDTNKTSSGHQSAMLMRYGVFRRRERRN